jgi:hypothetical protein
VLRANTGDSAATPQSKVRYKISVIIFLVRTLLHNNTWQIAARPHQIGNLLMKLMMFSP